MTTNPDLLFILIIYPIALAIFTNGLSEPDHKFLNWFCIGTAFIAGMISHHVIHNEIVWRIGVIAAFYAILNSTMCLYNIIIMPPRQDSSGQDSSGQDS